MSLARAWIGVLVIGLAAAACGGKVFIDLPGSTGGSGSGGGNGGSGAQLPTATSSSSSSGGGCSMFDCGEGSDGSCFCQGVCNEQNLEVDCQASAGGLFCACIENGVAIGKCQDNGGACDPLGGCCSVFFFGEG